MFKGGAIKITKLPHTDGEVQIYAKEQQSAAIARAENKPSAPDVKSNVLRRRGIERWLGELEQCSQLLLKIFDDIVERNSRDADIQNGLRILRGIASRIYENIKPMAIKFSDDKDWGRRRAHTLADVLFFKDDQIDSSYLMLETLQSLYVYLSYIKGNLRGMYPAAQALWDKELVDVVQQAMKDVARMEEWVLQQLALKAPQTLIVPVPVDDGQM